MAGGRRNHRLEAIRRMSDFLEKLWRRQIEESMITALRILVGLAIFASSQFWLVVFRSF